MILELMRNPEYVANMSVAEKFSGGLLVTALGMGITFCVLLILWGSIVVMSRMLNGSPKKNQEKPVVIQKTAVQPVVQEAVVDANDGADEELIAVITAAIAASLNTSMHNIIVRNITEYPSRQVAWSKAGIAEQIQSRF